MIKFDNFKFNSTNLTMDLLEGCRFVCGTAMIDTVTGDIYTPTLTVISGSFASEPISDSDFIKYTGTGTVRVADVKGASVAHMYLVNNTKIWFGGRQPIGVIVEDDKITFDDYLGNTQLVRKCVPNFSFPFRIVYLIEFDADMNPSYQSILLYNGDKVLGANTWNYSDVAEYIYVDTTEYEGSDPSFSFMMNALSRPITYLTIDVSEAPQESLSRLTSNLPLVYFGRYDGSVRVYQTNLQREVTFDLSQYNMLATTVTDNVNDAGIVTRARVTGALPEGEHIDLPTCSKYLLKFRVYQNPEIMSRADAILEAERIVQANFQETHQRTLEWRTMPFLENGDIVEIDGERYIYTNGQFALDVGMFGSVLLALESE